MTVVETTRKRDPFKKVLKLEALRRKQDAIRGKIAKIEAKEKAAARKAETRLKVIVGAAILANADLNPEARAGVVAVLERTVVARRDREFLKGRNWL